MPAELVGGVAVFVGGAGEAVAEGLQRDGQAVMLVLAEAGLVGNSFRRMRGRRGTGARVHFP